MCGRYSIIITPQDIVNQFGVSIDLPPAGLPENYNVAPTQSGLVIADESPDQLSLFRWGLIPFWAKEKKMGYRMINARSEGIEGKPSFREPIRKKRCLVIADSFYEWKREGKLKQPYRILPADDRLLVMAGIWSTWREPESGEEWKTYSIITTEGNADMQGLHDRMPVLLTAENEQSSWLEKSLPLPEVLALLHPAPAATLKSYPVSSALGNVRNNGPELHLPLQN